MQEGAVFDLIDEVWCVRGGGKVGQISQKRNNEIEMQKKGKKEPTKQPGPH